MPRSSANLRLLTFIALIHELRNLRFRNQTLGIQRLRRQKLVTRISD